MQFFIGSHSHDVKTTPRNGCVTGAIGSQRSAAPFATGSRSHGKINLDTLFALCLCKLRVG